MLSDFVVIHRGINNNHYYRIKFLASTSTWIRYYCTKQSLNFWAFGMIMKWFVIFHLHILKAMRVILPKYLLLSEKRNSPTLYRSNEKDFIHYLQQNNFIFSNS